MNILVITGSPWNDTNSVGNTLSNWFSNWGDTNFSTLYSRDALPNNSCCEAYFKVSPTNIIKNLFTPHRIGVRFDKNTYKNVQFSSGNKEWSITPAYGKGRRRVFLLLYEILYSSRIWLNNKLKRFIADQKPDLCFTFAISEPYRYHICKYLKSKSIPIVLFIADDVYGSYSSKKVLFNTKRIKRFESLINMADKVYGASEMMCEKYSALFNIQVEPLYKGCVLSEPKSFCNTPLRIAYAGNLLYGRSQTIGLITKALSEINNKNGKTLACLEIYTGTPITEEMASVLQVEGVSKIMGQRPFSEIVEILKTADIVLHVESFDKKEIEEVKYSFSTKIVDCLQSGSVFMVVGPKGIASVEYPKTIPGAIVIDNITDVHDALSVILSSPEKLLQNAKNTHAFAAEIFPVEKVREKLRTEFCLLKKQS
ncbi:MAG: hypothetical protein IKO23_02145 [Bacteroidales bacterium]|nr:hypothetical protein [Bacteroidales bacterium]